MLIELNNKIILNETLRIWVKQLNRDQLLFFGLIFVKSFVASYAFEVKNVTVNDSSVCIFVLVSLLLTLNKDLLQRFALI